jgi:hypothetical protein
VKTPRANVLFEYGYLTAALTRSRVALCRYTGVDLPSDFAGLTYVPMGAFEPTRLIDHQARVKIKAWAFELPALQAGMPAICQLHGYSGVWQNETVFQVWRRIDIQRPDYVIFKGTMILQVGPSGEGGAGCLYGNLQVQIGGCYTEFEISDRIIEARVFRDGSLKLRSALQSRQRIKLEGTPPQKDGFEPDLRGAREFDSIVHCQPDEPNVLRGQYSSDVGGEIYSKAIEKFYR